MLCAKQKLTGEIVNAYFASKAHGPFVCADCSDEVILKTGRRTVNHFAHVNPLACRYAEGESETHRRCKIEIFKALRETPGVSDVVLERPLGTNRSDVSANINRVSVAIEIQISSLSVETIMSRTIDYYRKGIYVLWLLPWTPKLDGKRYAPAVWEKWIHAAYFGRVYYWLKGLEVVSYHFEPSIKSIPRKSWYAEDGKKMTVGGYSRRLKRQRTAVRGRTLNLVADFVPKERFWWEGNGVKVPDAKLYMAEFPSTS
jgi:competence protein CoiA